MEKESHNQLKLIIQLLPQKTDFKQIDLRSVVTLNIKYKFKLGNHFSKKLQH